MPDMKRNAIGFGDIITRHSGPHQPSESVRLISIAPAEVVEYRGIFNIPADRRDLAKLRVTRDPGTKITRDQNQLTKFTPAGFNIGLHRT